MMPATSVLMIFSFLLFLLVIALGASALAVPFVRHFALSRGWVDVPDERRGHGRVTPRLGGLAILVGISVAVLSMTLIGWEEGFATSRMAYIWGGAMLMAGIGVADDIVGLGFKKKLVLQVFVANLLIWGGIHVDLSWVPGLGEIASRHHAVALSLSVLWIVGVVNAVNLIDGLDGLAGGVCLIGFSFLTAYFLMIGDLPMAVLAAIAAGAVGGFLLFNFNPASIFMGDTGSLLLGYLLAVGGIESLGTATTWKAYLVPVVLLGLPIVDTSVACFRRMIQGRSLFCPDSDHIHHRMLKRTGGSVRRAVLCLYGVAILYGALAMALYLAQTPTRIALVLVLAAIFTAVFLRYLGYLRVRSSVQTYRTVRGLQPIQHPLFTGYIPADSGTPEMAEVVFVGGDGDSEPIRISRN
jgi:UDP-GlcNAc:undecaprenyl-phosphate/decaprenyl-phosphate GlcNAc-1-phosphate transferase